MADSTGYSAEFSAEKTPPINLDMVGKTFAGEKLLSHRVSLWIPILPQQARISG